MNNPQPPSHPPPVALTGWTSNCLLGIGSAQDAQLDAHRWPEQAHREQGQRGRAPSLGPWVRVPANVGSFLPGSALHGKSRTEVFPSSWLPIRCKYMAISFYLAAERERRELLKQILLKNEQYIRGQIVRFWSFYRWIAQNFSESCENWQLADGTCLLD